MSDLNYLFDKQKLLMEKVPHDMPPHAFVKVRAALKLMDTLLRYLNSTGHKPWRPVPLSPAVQQGLMNQLSEDLSMLKYLHGTCEGHDLDMSEYGILPRQYISGFGIIEESIEYMNSLTDGSCTDHQFEELVDVLFFWLEQLAMSGRTTEEVVEEYERKHAINLKRYDDLKKGDTSWDKRGEGRL